MLTSIIKDGVTGISLIELSACMISAILLGAIIALVHMFRNDYTKNFIVTLIILPLLIQIIILLVNGNLGIGVAVAGAFSLVRFRSAQGTARDIGSVFWSMAVGLALGTGYIGFAFLLSIPLAIIQLTFFHTSFGENRLKAELEREIELVIQQADDHPDIFQRVLQKHTTYFQLTQLKVTKKGKYKFFYLVRLKESANERQLLKDIRKRYGTIKMSSKRSPSGKPKKML